ncbi:MAG: UbiX family flavin prenyltransferase [Devosia sp.]|nr:UbiX family flavin prenyltransferase [Devosia sp.]
MRRMIIAITGASGACYGVSALKMLRELGGVETHLILSPAGVRTMIEEGAAQSAEEVKALADVWYPHKDIGAAVASGSFRCDGMLVAPCSIKTLSGIAHCYDNDLVTRAADVCLKERRRVVLMVRETPLHAGHIALMDQATRNGAIITPPVPSFYTRPRSIDDLVRQTVGRALDLFDFDHPGVRRWKETAAPERGSEAGNGAAAPQLHGWDANEWSPEGTTGENS